MKNQESALTLSENKARLDTTVSPRSIVYRQSHYDIGGVHTFCWLCETMTDRWSKCKPEFAVVMYSAPCGMINIQFTNRDTAEEVFSLFARYEVSPYHAEDILEDREISATISFL